jgi:hypothetical protein
MLSAIFPVDNRHFSSKATKPNRHLFYLIYFHFVGKVARISKISTNDVFDHARGGWWRGVKLGNGLM